MMLEDVPPECGAFEGWSEDNSVEIEKGWIKKGDTIEELVAQIDEVDRPKIENVKAAIEAYNQYCAAGADPDFDRDPATLAPVLEPPFYAYPLYPCLLYTSRWRCRWWRSRGCSIPAPTSC